MRRRALLSGAAALGAAAALSACESGDHALGSSSTSASPTAAGDGSTAAPADSTDHKIADPGPRQGGLIAYADLMVVSGTSLTAEQIAAVKKTDGVYDVEVISVAQPVIENRSTLVAAVDPASYRNFTTAAAANTEAVWDRVAGGELALKSQLKTKVPLDQQGYLKLGSAASAPQVHVGAYTPQSPLIDAVVNTSWIKTLGMTPDNAMLVRTAGTAPKLVRKPLERLLGAKVSVQLVDIATRLGIDPSAQQVAIPTGSVADAVGVYHYTVLGGGRIAPDPDWVAEHIVTASVPIIGDIVCHEIMVPQLTAALTDVGEQGLTAAIKPSEYAGCYVPRFIAGTSTLSNHAFGLAVDLNAIENQRGTVGTMDPGVVEIFEHWGFTWGGTWHYTDPMHFEVNTVVTPKSTSGTASTRSAKSALASAAAQSGTDG